MKPHRFVLLAGAAALLAAPASLSSKTAAPSVPQAITASEKAEGAKAHPELLKEFGGTLNNSQTAYVTRVGQNIAVQSGLGNARSDFVVSYLNSPVNNAFAIPGGYIYITRGLVALTNDEAEMAGVLGHEVGHVAARHSKQRQAAAQRNSIIGLLGQVLGGVLGDNGGIAGLLGKGLSQYSGTVANLLTLKYSRTQETQADDLGMKYLSTAGYDPAALSTMLTSLALQTSLEARAAGGDARSVPEWASTHPDPAGRVSRAASGARKYATGGKRNRDQHLTAIDGMQYGDDPQQGVIEGRSFIHPVERLRFSVPTGYGMSNGTAAVSISGQGGQGQFTTAAYSGDLDAYVAAAFRAVAGDSQINIGAARRTTVNGIPSAVATARANTSNGQVDVTVFAYEFSRTQAYHFVTIVPAGRDPFGAMYQSVTRITATDAAAIKPRKLRIVTVGARDTVATLAARMAYAELKEDRFRALNGLGSAGRVTAGQKVKIVIY